MPGDGGAWFLPQIVGAAVAAEMSFTGDALDAQAALRCGPYRVSFPMATSLRTRLNWPAASPGIRAPRCA